MLDLKIDSYLSIFNANIIVQPIFSKFTVSFLVFSKFSVTLAIV